MRRLVDVALVLLGAACVFGPYLWFEALGGRQAIVVLTGSQPNGVVLAASYFLSWTWMVFASVPFLTGSLAFLLVRR